MSKPKKKAKAMDTNESWIVVFRPETNHPKYFPEVTTDQSNWYLNNPCLPLLELKAHSVSF